MTTITIERASLEKIIEKFAACGCEVCTRQSIEALKAALAAPATAPDLSAAYIGAREDLAIWKKRALEAEETARQLTRALAEEVNGPTFMGEPVLPATAPAQPERTPMTKEQREQVARRAEAAMNGNVNLSWRDALMSETEAFHDIKETP